MRSQYRLMLAFLFVSAIAAAVLGQNQPPAGEIPQFTSRPPTDSELIAGLREYPADIVSAILKLGAKPEILRQVASDTSLLQSPQRISPAADADTLNAIRSVSQLPDIVSVINAHPQAMSQLAELSRRSPGQIESRASVLRVAYRGAQLDGFAAWEAALKSNPDALRNYREAVTRFCEEQRKQFPDFPVVAVKDERYYLACPPGDLLLGYLEKNPPAAALDAVLLRWFSEFGASAIDTRALQASNMPAPPKVDPNLLALQSPASRSSLWSREVGGSNAGVGLVPVILQPEADQPMDARAAYAVMEHDRLWSPIWTPAPAPAPAPLPPQQVQASPMPAGQPPLVPLNQSQSHQQPTYSQNSGTGAPVYDMVPVGQLPRDDGGYAYNDAPITAYGDDDDVVLETDEAVKIVDAGTNDGALIVEEGVYGDPETESVEYVEPYFTQTVVYDYAPAWPYYSTFGYWGYPYGGWGYGWSPWWSWGCNSWWSHGYYRPWNYCYGDGLSFWFGRGPRYYSAIGPYYRGYWSPRLGVGRSFASGFSAGSFFGTRFSGRDSVRYRGGGIRSRSSPLASTSGVRAGSRGLRSGRLDGMSSSGVSRFLRGDGSGGVRGMRNYAGNRGNEGLVSPRSGNAGDNGVRSGVRGLRSGPGADGGSTQRSRISPRRSDSIGGNNAGAPGTGVRGLRGNDSGSRVRSRSSGVGEMTPINNGANSGNAGTPRAIRGLRPNNSSGGDSGSGPRKAPSISPRRIQSGNSGGDGGSGNRGGGIRGIRPRGNDMQFTPRSLAPNSGGGGGFRNLRGNDAPRISPRSLNSGPKFGGSGGGASIRGLRGGGFDGGRSAVRSGGFSGGGRSAFRGSTGGARAGMRGMRR